MTTATESMMKENQADRRRQIFHNQCESFVKRWAPDDRYQNAEFHADLMMLFRELQIQQGEVYARALSESMDRTLQIGQLLPTISLQNKPKT